MTQDQLLAMLERLIVRLFRETINVEIELPIQRITYADAMNKYGSDKPDLRFGMEIEDITDIVASSDVKVFASVAAGGGVVKAFNAKGRGPLVP